jgi:hypothetical protein
MTTCGTQQIWNDLTLCVVTLLCLILVGCGDGYPAESDAPKNDAEWAAYRAEDIRLSGPGYPDLQGKVLNYTYVGFAGFRVLIERNRLKFQGVSGEFDGITMLQTPQVSKVSDDVYFMSWQVMGDMGDNVVVNVRDMKVFAHLGDGRDYRQVHGEIQCFGLPNECHVPEGEPDSTLGAGIRVMLRGGSPKSPEGDAPKAAPTPAARALEGKTLVFRYPDGSEVTLRVENYVAVVDEGAGPAPRGGAFTQPADNIYFVSWDGKNGGQHIVLNKTTMEVHDQITADGLRASVVARVEYFGPTQGPD